MSVSLGLTAAYSVCVKCLMVIAAGLLVILVG